MLAEGRRTLPTCQVRRTWTWDQGSEMARHDLLAPHFSDGIFFAEPASPWQRGANEKRQRAAAPILPKGRDLNAYDADYLRLIEDRLNNGPAGPWAGRPIDVFTPRPDTMTDVNVAEIRRMHRVGGMAIKAIGRRLGVSTTVGRPSTRGRYMLRSRGSTRDGTRPRGYAHAWRRCRERGA